MRRYVIAAAMMSMVAGPTVEAQDAPPTQTLENARVFATTTMVGMRFYMSGSPRPIDVTQAVEADRCVLSLAVHGDAMTVGETEWSAVPATNWSFNFGNITDIAPVENSTQIRIQFRGESVHWLLDTRSPSLQARLAYAMEFIRQACDPTAGTGF